MGLSEKMEQQTDYNVVLNGLVALVNNMASYQVLVQQNSNGRYNLITFVPGDSLTVFQNESGEVVAAYLTHLAKIWLKREIKAEQGIEGE